MTEFNNNTARFEEEIIARTSTGMQSLPMLDVIFERMATGLNGALKTKAAVLGEAVVSPVEYSTWAKAVAALDPHSICGVAEATPWSGSVIVAMDTDFFYSTIETQMNGNPIPGTAPKRAPSLIERRLAARLATLICDEMAENFTRLTDVAFKLETIESIAQVNSLYGANSPCAVTRFQMKIGECEGQMIVLMPMTTLEPAQTLLSKMFLGDKLGGDGTWREYLLQRISGSSVSVYARLHSVNVSLGDVMEWRVGDTVELGIDNNHEATIVCSGIPILHGAVGKKKNDRLALKVTREEGEPRPKEGKTIDD